MKYLIEYNLRKHYVNFDQNQYCTDKVIMTLNAETVFQEKILQIPLCFYCIILISLLVWLSQFSLIHLFFITLCS